MDETHARRYRSERLPKYLAQPARLNAIMNVLGIEDDAESVRSFVRNLTDVGINNNFSPIWLNRSRKGNIT
jgi:hypothetical protein